MLMLLVVPLVAITGFPQWIPHFSALAFDDDDDDDDDLPWPIYVNSNNENGQHQQNLGSKNEFYWLQ